MGVPGPANDGGTSPSVFSRVVVGVDGTEPGFEACRQATRLVDPDGTIELLSAVRLADAALAGYSTPRLAEDLEREAKEALRAAEAIVGPRAISTFVNGPPPESLLRVLEQREVTLVAVGTHGHSRTSEIVLGGVSGELLHKAPCSVLVARPPAAGDAFPRTLIVGVDGSPQSEAALTVAKLLSRRFDAPLRIVTAQGGKGVDLDRVGASAPHAEILDGRPADVLVEASASADLLVVGSRGLHGLRSLGSVSERVAHRAPSSVVVVRPQGA